MGWRSTFHIAHIIVEVQANTEVCKDEMENIIALYASASSHSPDVLFLFEQYGETFELRVNGESVWTSTDSRDFPPALEIHLYRQLIARLAPEQISLHASSVEFRNEVCLFAGISGAGKSSLCTAALLNGAAYLTDEFSLLDEHGLIHPFPRPLQWDSIDHPAFDVEQMLTSGMFDKAEFSFSDPENNIFTSHLWLPKQLCHDPLKLGAIILPKYTSDAPKAELKPIRRGEALMKLPEHLQHEMPPAKRLRELNSRIPKDTQFYFLRFSDVFAAWETVKHHLS